MFVAARRSTQLCSGVSQITSRKRTKEVEYAGPYDEIALSKNASARRSSQSHFGVAAQRREKALSFLDTKKAAAPEYIRTTSSRAPYPEYIDGVLDLFGNFRRDMLPRSHFKRRKMQDKPAFLYAKRIENCLRTFASVQRATYQSIICPGLCILGMIILLLKMLNRPESSIACNPVTRICADTLVGFIEIMQNVSSIGMVSALLPAGIGSPL